MKNARLMPVIVLMFAAIAPIHAAEAPQARTPPANPSPSPTPKEIVLDWGAEKIALQHARAGDPIVVRVTGFNFLRYKLKLDVNEKVIESYAFLEGLWSQVLSLGKLTHGFGQPTSSTQVDPFDAALNEWLAHVELGRQAALDVNETFTTSVGLTTTESGDLAMKGKEAAGFIKNAVDAELRTHTLLIANISMDRWTRFQTVEKAHDSVVALLRHIEQAGRQASEGQRQPLGVKKPGTLISITLIASATADGTAAGQKGPFQVFVDSRLPLHFHAGLTYTSASEFSLEKIRALSGADVFQEIAGTAKTTGLTAFLTLEPLKGKWGAIGPTLGTEVTSPGKQIFVGGSLRLSRFSLTAGKASKVEEVGVNPIAKEVAGRIGAVKLYETFSRTRVWHPFVAISFSVFPEGR